MDFEERVDFRRLHRYRLARTRQSLANSGLGAMLCFDQHNIRYISSTVIGEWARDKLIRYCLLTGNGEPWVWDFGSAARHHKLYCPWLHEDHVHAGNPGMRGAIGPNVGLFEAAAKEIKDILVQEGVAGMPLGLDVCEPGMLFALQAEGPRGSRRPADDARGARNQEPRRDHAAQHRRRDGGRRLPGHRRRAQARRQGKPDRRARGTSASTRWARIASRRSTPSPGERCSPHPHNFTDRLIRPGDQAYFDIIHSFIGYRTCYYRTFSVGKATPAQKDAYKRARQWMDDAISMLKPGVTTDKVAKMFPKSTEIGFETEMAAFGLNFCHGLGLGLHERPLISRLNSFIEPYELKAGMVFAVETFCPAKDGVSAARIEEEVVLTPDGAKIISLYPAQELPVANAY